jgi:hypothetical protein
MIGAGSNTEGDGDGGSHDGPLSGWDSHPLKIRAFSRRTAIHAPMMAPTASSRPGSSATPSPLERHIAEGSFAIAEDRIIRQIPSALDLAGQYGRTPVPARP